MLYAYMRTAIPGAILPAETSQQYTGSILHTHGLGGYCVGIQSAHPAQTSVNSQQSEAVRPQVQALLCCKLISIPLVSTCAVISMVGVIGVCGGAVMHKDAQLRGGLVWTGIAMCLSLTT